MLLRSSMIVHPTGFTIETPLLVPSFSSKGFKTSAPKQGRKCAPKGRPRRFKGNSEISKIFRYASEFVTESMLVSAYDIYYGYLPDLSRFKPVPMVTIVDSGGYETGAGYDLSTIYRYRCQHNPWTEAMLKQVYDAWPDSVSAIFVNYDRGTAGKPLSLQIERAEAFLSRYLRQLHCFLMKPEAETEGGLKGTIIKNSSLLRRLSNMHIVGVTEKELGTNILDKMITIAVLRKRLDHAGVRAPIQVFGALDPLTSCLYFIAGAEIFDGLTWLRFAYRTDLCVYLANHWVLERGGLSAEEDYFKSKIIIDNYYYLRDLQLKMGIFYSTRDFNNLPNSDCLRNASNTLESKLEGGK